MPVSANSIRLRSRLSNYIRTLRPAAQSAINHAAADTIRNVQASVRTNWSDPNYQIGFDIDSFVASIREPETIPEGVGILNVNRMGTASDFEQIGQGSGLWHEGGKRGDAFRRFILERPGATEDLAQLRKIVWGNTNPQWWFFEYGNESFAGAFPQRPGTYAIRETLFRSRGRVQRIITNIVNQRLRLAGAL